MGLTRTAGPADRAHLESICLREKHMLDAIRCLSLGRSSTLVAEGIIPGPAPSSNSNSNSNSTNNSTNNSKASSSYCSAFPAETAAPSPAPACTGPGFVKAVKPAGGGSVLAVGGAVGFEAPSKVVPGGLLGGLARGKDVSVDGVGGNGAGIPLSPTSDATAETYFSSETPSSLAALSLSIGSVPEGIAASASASAGGVGVGGDGGGSTAFEIAHFRPSGEAAAAAAAAAAMDLEATALTESTRAASTPPRVSGTDARASPSPTLQASQSSEVTVEPPTARSPVERRADEVVPGRGNVTAPAGGSRVIEESPWKKELPATLSPAARRYAATYLATCVRQALQRNPDQMARCG